MINKIRKSISIKISLLVTFFALLVIFIMGIYFTSYIYKSIEDKFGWTLEHIAKTGALQISGNDHDRIQKQSDSLTTHFRRSQNVLRNIRDTNDLSNETIYTFRKIKNGVYAFALMTHDKTFVGDLYEPPKATRQLIDDAFNGTSGYSKVYIDKHGEWISGYAPIYNQAKKITGILAVDYKVTRFLSEARMQVLSFLSVSVFLFLIATIFSYLLGRKISAPIVDVSRAARRLEEGDYSYRIDTNKIDETGQLIQSFNALSSTLEERFELMKYVSPQTLEMISQMQSGQASEKGEVRTAAILFADIRGYTRFTELHEPEHVIATLNNILGLEANIIDEHCGHVDKFVGDEVVALFDEDDSAVCAIQAALRLRADVKALAIPDGQGGILEIGIGISYGEVILGNIGSKTRKDFTIIGNNVNLAARLCSAAKSGEIYVSSHVFHEIEFREETADLPPLHLKGKARIKGFKELMHIYYL